MRKGHILTSSLRLLLVAAVRSRGARPFAVMCWVDVMGPSRLDRTTAIRDGGRRPVIPPLVSTRLPRTWRRTWRGTPQNMIPKRDKKEYQEHPLCKARHDCSGTLCRLPRVLEQAVIWEIPDSQRSSSGKHNQIEFIQPSIFLIGRSKINVVKSIQSNDSQSSLLFIFSYG